MSRKKPTPSRTNKTAVPARPKYTEGERAACSIDKNSAGRDAGPALNSAAGPNQAKFVHKSGSKPSHETTSEHSKPANPKQRACRLWFDRVIKNGGVRGIREEFVRKVQKYKPELSWKEGEKQTNVFKNRFDDVHLIDKTRVMISINPDGDDYIHASWVNVAPDLKFICAQGPLSSTVHQFWLMCIQEDVKLILQLCKNVEKGDEKCADYFKPDSTVWEDYEPVQVRVVEKSQPVPGMRKVTKTKLEVKFNDRTQTVTHVLFAGWPDHGMAESLATCRELRNLVHKLHEQKPVVVHCAAGIGRTGTFTAVEMACQKLLIQHTGDFTILDLVKELRDQRFRAVQNDKYLFIFRCVLEILIAEDGVAKTNEVVDFIKKFDEFVDRKKKEASNDPRSRRR